VAVHRGDVATRKGPEKMDGVCFEYILKALKLSSSFTHFFHYWSVRVCQGGEKDGAQCRNLRTQGGHCKAFRLAESPSTRRVFGGIRIGET
jgi:hypothetical protein